MSSLSPSSQATSPSLFQPAFVRVLGVQMAFGLSYSAFLLLPKFLRLEHGSSSTEIGWVAGAAVVAGAVFAPLVGTFLGRMPRRLLLGIGMSLAGFAALGFALVEEVGWGMYALRALQGLAWASVTNVTASMVAASVPRSELARSIGYLGLSMLVTNALAPAVTEPLANAFGWQPVFAAAGVLALLSFALFPGLPRELEPAAADERDESNLSPRLLAVHYVSLLMGAGIGVMFTFTQPYALEQGATRVGDFFFGYVAAAVFVRVVLGRLADRVGPARVAAVALGTYSLVVLASSLLRPSWLIPLGLGIGVSHGFLYPALTATGLAQLAPVSRSRFLGWFSGAFNLGFALTVLLLGPIADLYGFFPVYLIVGAWLASGVVPLVWTHRLPRPKPMVS